MIVLWFLLGCLWLFAKVAIASGVLLLIAAINWRIRSARARRRKRKAAERETWARSVVKETKPLPIREGIWSQDVDLTKVLCTDYKSADPDLTAYIALKTPLRQRQAAEAVRRKIKRSKK